MKQTLLLLLVTISFVAHAQQKDTSIIMENKVYTLPTVFIREHFDYKFILRHIQDDTTFYKAFKNLRILNYTAFNDIKMFNKGGGVQASLLSKTKQYRIGNCRTMEVLQEHATGDFYDKKHRYNYLTGQLYAISFFTDGKICGENNIVAGDNSFDISDKKGAEKHEEQMKILFFNPGKKIPGIPFFGNKLDLYDADAAKIYNYQITYDTYSGIPCYVFSITPKKEYANSINVIMDEMTTWFSQATMEVLARNYTMSYHMLAYDFDVHMEVQMTKLPTGLTVPSVLRYNGNWFKIFDKRERGSFTATLFNFSESN